MINELRIVDRTRLCIPWWKDVSGIKRKRVLKFQPGLNILWGPNGSGKTTILQALAKMTFCEQGYSTTLTSNAVRDFFPIERAIRMKPPEGLPPEEEQEWRGLFGFKVVHDGQAVVHVDPSQAVGMIGGMAGFDDDFFSLGLRECMSKGSAGETTLRRLDRVVRILVGEDPWPEIVWKAPRRANDRLNVIEKLLEGEIPKGPPTVILDEPDRSLSVPYQSGLWKNLPGMAKDFQIIVASHSLFAVDVPGANYIELEPGYLKQCRDTVKMAFASEPEPAIE